MFPPTYKFAAGTEEYEWKRKPAWTDRVLTFTRLQDRCSQFEYCSYGNLRSSDHRPVAAMYICQVSLPCLFCSV